MAMENPQGMEAIFHFPLPCLITGWYKHAHVVLQTLAIIFGTPGDDIYSTLPPSPVLAQLPNQTIRKFEKCLSS